MIGQPCAALLLVLLAGGSNVLRDVLLFLAATISFTILVVIVCIAINVAVACCMIREEGDNG